MLSRNNLNDKLYYLIQFQSSRSEDETSLSRASVNELMLNDKLFSGSSQRLIKAANIRERNNFLTFTKCLERERTTFEIDYRFNVKQLQTKVRPN